MALPIVLVPHPHVRVDPKVLAGSPHVIGSRVPVRRLWAFYRAGTSVEKLVRRFPQLGPAKIFDALAFAFDNEEVIEADLSRERELLQRSGPASAQKANQTQQMALPFASEGFEGKASRISDPPKNRR
jgi:uncharacterized protein (DUF433 family)